MRLALRELNIENFKGIKSLHLDFPTNRTNISGENGSGKTTIFDAVTWLLFNKDSLGAGDFEIRPLDENGKTVDMIDIKVSANFVDLDTGKDISFGKTQSQKWTTHRGDDTATFTGNVNTYEVNGFPQSEKEYKAQIANIIDEEQFKLLSNPAYFVSLHWKEQREIIMSLIAEESDLEFAKKANTDGQFDILIPELERAPKTSDIADKWRRTKKELKEKLDTIPIRIDELTHNKVIDNMSELVAQKADLEAKIATAKSGNNTAVVNGLKTELSELKLAVSTMESKAHEEWLEKNKAYRDAMCEHGVAKDIIRTDIRKAELDSVNLNAQIERYNAELSRLGEEYMTVHKATFDATPYYWNGSAEVCPTCGRKLPDEEIAKAKATLEERGKEAHDKFIAEQSEKEKALIDKGNEAKAKAEEAKKNAKSVEDKIKALYASLEELTKKDAEIEALNVPEATPHGQKDYDYLIEQIADVEKKIAEATSASAPDTTAYEVELQSVNDRISALNNNANIDARIEELQKEQKDVAQKIADAEKMTNAFEKFIKAKLESVTGSVNALFSKVNFKLFDTLLNGGVEETCTMTYNGVPYSSLNNGMRICGGLDIINTLSKHFNKTVFVFVDNAEAVTSRNFPEMEGQMIKLLVSEEKGLTIKNEE